MVGMAVKLLWLSIAAIIVIIIIPSGCPPGFMNVEAE